MYRIQYSNCWEDAEVVVKALDIKSGGTYLSIASAGDNTLSIISCGPDLVLAVDKNPAQLACLELRKTAIEHLSYEDTLAFLGVAASNRRMTEYGRIRPSLSPDARRFWDEHSRDIERGIIHAGSTEFYFKRFRDLILPLAISRSDQKKILQNMPVAERARRCDTVLNKPRYRIVMRTVFSRVLVRQFRVGAYSTFHHSGNGNIARIIMERVKKGLNAPQAYNNPYITYIMTGNYSDALPHYLRPDVFVRIKKNLGSLKLFCGTVQDALTSQVSYRFNGYNLSDIFEYMNERDARSCVEQCVRTAAQGARIAYWNTLKEDVLARNTPAHVQTRPHLARELFKMSKSFFYDSLVIAEVG